MSELSIEALLPRPIEFTPFDKKILTLNDQRGQTQRDKIKLLIYLGDILFLFWLVIWVSALILVNLINIKLFTSPYPLMIILFFRL